MKKLFLTMTILAMATAAYAGPTSCKVIKEPAVQAMGSWYVAGYGGMNFKQTGIKNWWMFGSTTNKKIGWNAGVKVGYNFPKLACCPCGLMYPVLEAEYFVSSFNRNEKFAGIQGGTPPTTDKFNVLTNALMVNALAKFDCAAFQPYIGVGAGFYHMSMDLKENAVGNPPYKANLLHGAGFAFQGLAGCDYKLDANWALFAEYKWFAMCIADAKNKPTAGFNFVKSVMGQQMVNLGVRYQF